MPTIERGTASIIQEAARFVMLSIETASAMAGKNRQSAFSAVSFFVTALPALQMP